MFKVVFILASRGGSAQPQQSTCSILFPPGPTCAPVWEMNLALKTQHFEVFRESARWSTYRSQARFRRGGLSQITHCAWWRYKIRSIFSEQNRSTSLWNSKRSFSEGGFKKTVRYDCAFLTYGSDIQLSPDHQTLWRFPRVWRAPFLGHIKTSTTEKSLTFKTSTPGPAQRIVCTRDRCGDFETSNVHGRGKAGEKTWNE